MWIGLSPTERQLIELPFYQHRWSQHSIDAALRTAFSSTNSASPTSSTSTGGGYSDVAASMQSALVPRRRFLSDMIELDLQMSPRIGEAPFGFLGMGGGFGSGESIGQNLTLRDIVTGIIANTVSRRGVVPSEFSFESSYPPAFSGSGRPPGPGNPDASDSNNQPPPPIE